LAASTKSSMRGNSRPIACARAAAKRRASPSPWPSKDRLGRQLALERRRIRPGVRLAGADPVGLEKQWVGVPGAGEHPLVEATGVVRAEQRERALGGEGEIQQRLVAPALVQLRGAAAGPDRFTDPAQPAPIGPVLADEVAPGGDDPRRVPAQLLHIGEADPLAATVQRVAQRVEPRPRCRDQNRLVGLEALPDERHRAGQELIGVGVEERLVPKAGLGFRWALAHPFN
jgi:hypothetical protein